MPIYSYLATPIAVSYTHPKLQEKLKGAGTTRGSENLVSVGFKNMGGNHSDRAWFVTLPLSYSSSIWGWLHNLLLNAMPTRLPLMTFWVSRRLIVPWMPHLKLGLNFHHRMRYHKMVPWLNMIENSHLEEKSKQDLREKFIACTKADVRLNNLMSRARPCS